MRRILGPAACTAAALAVLGAAGGAAGATTGPEPRVLLRITDERITESSGLAASRRHPGILWTHNDSGDEARVYAVAPDGTVRAVLSLRGLVPRDWEAMAAGPGAGGRPSLWIGDIGDNRLARTNGLLVHRVAEPDRLRTQTVRATSYRLRYPDGQHDAEALLVHPRTGRLWVVTKSVTGGAVYTAPQNLDPAAPNILERVAAAPPVVTDGTYLDDGRFVLRSYSRAYVYAGPGALEATLELPDQEQGESAAATDAATLLVGSEGAGSAVWQVAVPPRAAASGEPPAAGPTRPAEGAEAGARPGNDSLLGRRLAVTSALVAGAAALAAAAWLRRRS